MSDPSYRGPERRRYPRIPFWYIVKYSLCADSSEVLENQYSSNSKNLSQGGILLETGNEYPASTILEIELDVPVDNEKHVYAKVIGKVIRATCIEKGKAYDTAIEFVSVPEEYRPNILRLLDVFQ